MLNRRILIAISRGNIEHATAGFSQKQMVDLKIRRGCVAELGGDDLHVFLFD
jgi:hypothetical protein